MQRPDLGDLEEDLEEGVTFGEFSKSKESRVGSGRGNLEGGGRVSP